jgi:hypothetical protein
MADSIIARKYRDIASTLPMCEAADQAVLLPAVEVIPWSEAVALLPVEGE